MPIIQEAIHKIEVAGGMRHLRIGLIALAVIGVTTLYNFRCFKNMSTQEAMDSAQLARNIAAGKGYSTCFIRPFSMFLIRRQNEPRSPYGTRLSQLSQVQDRHPDIANPPAYPCVLAGLMKVLPFRYAIPEKPAFWRYQPDFLISAFNQLLFFGLIVAIFFLALRLFDRPTAWLSAALLFGADILWRFSMSGLSTMFLLLIFVGLVWCLVLIEETVREGNRGLIPLVVLALGLGLSCGLGALTRYSFGWMIILVVIFLLLLPPRIFLLPGAERLGHNIGVSSRPVILSVTIVVFLVLTVPWIIRNFHVSGTPFGTAGYFIYDGTALFPENRLERSLQPELPHFTTLWLTVLTQKVLINVRQIVENDLLRLGGGFIGLFFLVGLLVPVTNPGASKLRYFLLGSLVILVIAQALGRTHLSDDSPGINIENLLVLLAPFVILFGVQFFWLLLNQIYLPFRELRYVVVGLFCVVTCLPMLLSLLPPKTLPIAYPPYLPPYIQTAARFVREDGLAMSDIPWAMAWYGNVATVWTTQGSEGFIEIDSLEKPIKELYLSSVTLNRGLSQWIRNRDGWGYLLLQSLSQINQRQMLQGYVRWPMEVNFVIERGTGGTLPLTLHYLQTGWPDEFLVTAREKPVTPVESK